MRIGQSTDFSMIFIYNRKKNEPHDNIFNSTFVPTFVGYLASPYRNKIVPIIDNIVKYLINK